MIGILCEKPSAARNFARALGGEKGSFHGESYLIVSALGHLFGFIDDASLQVAPEKKERYHSWSPENLPWDENDFLWKYEQKPKTGDVVKAIAAGMKGCDEICIATDDDPSGEGELLAWEIISRMKLKAGRYTRMFFEDESPASIQKAFDSRKTLGSDLACMEQDPDYQQALFRTKWDYLSMQWTRLATAYSRDRQVPRQGRLKSAMVKLVGDQLALCNAYVKKPFFQNRFRDENKVIYTSRKEPTYDTAEEVPQHYEESPVVCDSKAEKRSIPPRFLDLAALSSALAARGIRSSTVLKTYQAMYEHQVVSYPRTDDRVITPEQFHELLPLAEKIARLVNVDPAILTHRRPRPTHVKAGGAHGANRPGPSVPASLESLEKYGPGAREIYQLLARNYLATLAEDYCYEQQKGHVEKYPQFEGTANVPLSAGWKAVYGDVMAEEDENENASGLGMKAVPFVYEGANPKPKEPTMKWLMKQLEKYNVGTGATRTSIYADVTNARMKYPLLEDKRGKITMAECGTISYALLPNTHISDLKMTEQVFAEMAEVAAGRADPQECLHRVQQMIIDDRAVMKANGSAYREQVRQERPAKEHVTGMLAGEEVSFSREWGGHRFSDGECEALLAGREIAIENLKSKTGRTYSVKGSLQKQKYRGRTFYGFKSLGFEGGTEGGVPASWCGHAFTEEEKELLSAGKRIEAQDFLSKKGKKFKARIHYDSRTGRIRLDDFLK